MKLKQKNNSENHEIKACSLGRKGGNERGERDRGEERGGEGKRGGKVRREVWKEGGEKRDLSLSEMKGLLLLVSQILKGTLEVTLC